VVFLGATQRVDVRLDPRPGVRALNADYGEEGILLRALRLAGQGEAPLEVGQRTWVGVGEYHVLPRRAAQVLLVVDAAAGAGYLGGLVSVLRQIPDAGVTVLVTAEHEQEAQRQVRRARKLFRGCDGRASVRVVAERSWTEPVLAETEAGRFDLLVVNGGSPADDRRLADAEQLARRASVSVLVVKGERPSLDRLLLCTAGGEPGKLDILFGGRLARRLGAGATLLHVLPAAVDADETTSRLVARHLEHGVQTLRARGVRAGTAVRQGPVAEEILAEAAEGNYDMIVVGGHISASALPFREHDLAAEVVRRADRPVLVVRGSLR
jgi:nucleotide-binding universal stress UspA family protein